jgi:hypothetical protein
MQLTYGLVMLLAMAAGIEGSGLRGVGSGAGRLLKKDNKGGGGGSESSAECPPGQQSYPYPGQPNPNLTYCGTSPNGPPGSSGNTGNQGTDRESQGGGGTVVVNVNPQQGGGNQNPPSQQTPQQQWQQGGVDSEDNDVPAQQSGGQSGGFQVGKGYIRECPPGQQLYQYPPHPTSDGTTGGNNYYCASSPRPPSSTPNTDGNQGTDRFSEPGNGSNVVINTNPQYEGAAPGQTTGGMTGITITVNGQRQGGGQVTGQTVPSRASVNRGNGDERA